MKNGGREAERKQRQREMDGGRDVGMERMRGREGVLERKREERETVLGPESVISLLW